MRRFPFLFIVFVLLLAMLSPAPLRAEEPAVVRAILFYSPTCPHCHKVIQEGLPPIVEKYGDQLQIVLINTTVPAGAELYQAAADWGGIPPNQRGVPLLVVGDEMLFGDVEIPSRLPGIIDQGLAEGGIDWPDFPGMAEVITQIEAQQAEATKTAQAGDQSETGAAGQTDSEATVAEAEPNNAPQSTSNEQTPGVAPEENVAALSSTADYISVSNMSIPERLAVDPLGSTIALIVLGLMIITVIAVVVSWIRKGLPDDVATGWRLWIIPVMMLIGIGVAAYLAFVETTATEAICGPVGNCNAVQQSPYARLFGVLPIGILGMIGYVVMLVLWFWQRYGPTARTEKTAWMLAAVALIGVLFSAYLTFLEPFVIAAVCMWCVTSAVIMTLLLWLSYRWRIPPAHASAAHAPNKQSASS